MSSSACDAATALDQLEAELDVWTSGAMAALVLHIHRELIHHLSEVCLLRDLYLHTNGAPR